MKSQRKSQSGSETFPEFWAERMLKAIEGLLNAEENAKRDARPMRFLRIADVARRTGLSRKQINQLVSDNKFPLPVRVFKNQKAWVDLEVDAFVRDRIKSFLGSY